MRLMSTPPETKEWIKVVIVSLGIVRNARIQLVTGRSHDDDDDDDWTNGYCMETIMTLAISSADGGGWDQGEAEKNKRAGLSENDNIPLDSFSLNVFLMFLHSNLLRKIMDLTVLHIEYNHITSLRI